MQTCSPLHVSSFLPVIHHGTGRTFASFRGTFRSSPTKKVCKKRSIEMPHKLRAQNLTHTHTHRKQTRTGIIYRRLVPSWRLLREDQPPKLQIAAEPPSFGCICCCRLTEPNKACQRCPWSPKDQSHVPSFFLLRCSCIELETDFFVSGWFAKFTSPS